jgi:ADP-ribose pyrophosphatase YjhB (NUDIX family)
MRSPVIVEAILSTGTTVGERIPHRSEPLDRVDVMASVRQAVRVVLVDDERRVLLLRHEGPHDDHHWAPPGGGVEPGESLEAAAARELWEEVGFSDVALTRPVWTWVHRFRYHGEQITQHETIYVTRMSHRNAQGQDENLALDGIVEARWWRLDELAGVTDDVWPTGLSILLPALLETDLDPDEPLALDGGTGRPERP